MPGKAKNARAPGAQKDFPIFSRLVDGRPIHYLDNAATTQKPSCVIAAEEGYYLEYCANVHRGAYKFSEEATDRYEKAREAMARFIGAKPEEVIFTRGATESLNLLAHSLAKTRNGKKWKVAITGMEHHSNTVPWQIAGRGLQTSMAEIPLDAKTLALDMGKAEPAIKGSAVFSFTHVSNAIGRINNARELAGIAKDLGVPSCVDAAQSAAHMEIDVKRLGCDFMAFSGHKMLGPTGIGVLYMAGDWGERLPPFMGGGDMIRAVGLQKSTFAAAPQKFEAGTMPIAQAIGLAEAAGYLRAHMDGLGGCAGLANALQKGLEDAGATVYRGKGGKGFAPIVSFSYPGMHPHDIATILDRRNVMIRSGHHCAMPLHKKLGLAATCRASLHMYNTAEDVQELLAGLEDAKKTLL
ncbi:MAG: cysteine desulfurase [Candidatus Micrarchaeia archaeon]